MTAANAIFDLLRESQKPFVFFRLPNASQVQLYFQEDFRCHNNENLEQEGFVFKAFDTKKSSYCIPSDKRMTFDWSPEVFKKKTTPNLATKFENKEEHISLINKVQDCIRKGELKKVVLSKKVSVPIQNPIGFDYYLKLLSAYPDGMVYFWNHPETGSWIGATPEKLLTVDESHYHTMALAGTLVYKEGEEPNWTDKEIEEQQFVVAAIEEGIATSFPGVTVERSERHTKKAGNIQHLCTDIRFSTGSLAMTDIISVLHPTPAVGGLPKQASLDFITKNEGYDRQYYSGVLGPVTLDQKELFVNLRCGQLRDSFFDIYVGGGITAASQSEKEWEELQRKSETLLSWL